MDFHDYLKILKETWEPKKRAAILALMLDVGSFDELANYREKTYEPDEKPAVFEAMLQKGNSEQLSNLLKITINPEEKIKIEHTISKKIVVTGTDIKIIECKVVNSLLDENKLANASQTVSNSFDVLNGIVTAPISKDKTNVIETGNIKNVTLLRAKNIFNHPWLIAIGSTVIGGLIVGLILYFGFGIGKSDLGTLKTQQTTSPTSIASSAPISTPPTQQPQQTTTAVVQLSTFSPTEIMASIDNLPPYQQNTAGDNYKGLIVKWDVKFSYTFKTASGLDYISTYYTEVIRPGIDFEIIVDDYPQFKTMAKGQIFNVQGTIDSVNFGTIKLIQCRLTFN